MADDATRNEAVTPEEIRSTLRPFEVAAAELEMLVEIIDTREKLEFAYESLRLLSASRLGDTITSCHRSWNQFNTDSAMLVIAQGVMGLDVLHPAFESARARFELCRPQFAEVFRRSVSNRPTQTLKVTDRRTLTVVSPRNEVIHNLDITRIPDDERTFWIAFARKMVADGMANVTDDSFPVERDLGGWATFAAELSTPKLVFEGYFNNRRDDDIRVIIREHLWPYIDQDVVMRMCTPGMVVPENLDPQKFHILYNIRAQGSSTPLEEGLPLIGKNGEYIGDLVGNKLYVVGNPLAESYARLEQVLTAAGRELALASEDDAQETMRNSFVRETMTQFSGIRRSTAVREADITESEQRLQAAYRAQREYEAEYALRGTNAQSILGHEFDVQARGILNIEKIHRLEVTNGELVVTTRVIECMDERTRRVHELGVYKIHIPLIEGYNVRFFNQSRQIGGKQAPHVSENGVPCYGNTATLFPQLIRDRDYVSVVELAIAFLESANTSDAWGQHIASWPQAQRPQGGGVGGW